MAELENKAQDSFKKWLEEARKLYPLLTQVPENLLSSCFYAGAAFGSEQAGEIIRVLLK